MEENWNLARKRNSLYIRAAMIQAIREFFIDKDYLEVETPSRIPGPAPECHIDAIPSDGWYLHTSPELCMKRLLAAGYPRIFQITRCFRGEERGSLHIPEFTLLEWYTSGADYFRMMEECEELIVHVALSLGHEGKIHYRGKEIDIRTPWERISVKDAFMRYSTVTMEKALKDDCFDEIMIREIEPRFADTNRLVFLYDYPVAMGALARVKKTDPEVAERFELYMGGLELANAFSELTDPAEQRARFEEELKNRRASGRVVYPMPEKFLSELINMPESSGIALGVDRLAMIFTDSASIDDVVAFTPEEL
ncbi:MAG: EF-P lysine aminoacylase GenX [Deltaproteobacteria bacterium]|nr:EF-P lysine aminoacylase GenX [Deltaproteobacteria bacterium]MBW2595903.1 EF-P lysine aminoacylase GenX [Deltaproteobacteria bacterium]MBW2650512.1 EF-P lysine aminoacylase GenX [Deltaproteobacteria bacterium]